VRLEATVEGKQEEVSAARLLEPIYRQAERWDRLADVLEVPLVASERVSDKVDDLKQVADLCRHKIDQPRRAFDALLRAHELAPEDRELWDDLETLAADLEAWEDLVGAFHGSVDASALLGEEQVALALRLAGIREERLGQTDEAAAAYERVLELDPDRAVAYDALESLYTRMGRWDALVRTLDRKALIAETDAERLTIQLKVCDLLEEVLEDHEKAAEAYQQVLALDPGNLVALTALERLYAGASRWADLADILRTQIAARGEGDEGRAARFRLGRVLANELEEHVQAIETWREVLDSGPHDEATASLE
jgi:tetratricopeptide (TPR) repeat protein